MMPRQADSFANYMLIFMDIFTTKWLNLEFPGSLSWETQPQHVASAKIKRATEAMDNIRK